MQHEFISSILSYVLCSYPHQLFNFVYSYNNYRQYLSLAGEICLLISQLHRENLVENQIVQPLRNGCFDTKEIINMLLAMEFDCLFWYPHEHSLLVRPHEDKQGEGLRSPFCGHDIISNNQKRGKNKKQKRTN